MKSKLFARILCIVLIVMLVVSVIIVAVPMIRGSAAAVVPVKGSSGTVTTDYVNLRSGAGTDFSIVTTMRVNTKVVFEEAAVYNSNWYKVKELATNKSGYIRNDLVAFDNASSIKLCATKASTYVGCQYAFWQTGAQTPKWSSSNTSVATIDSNGVLTAKAAGTTTITAAEGSNSSTCAFTVRNGTSTGISSSSVNLTVGKTTKLTAKTSVNWFSSNPNVATVSDGTVTAKGVGYATISAYTSSGASTCLVKVNEQAQPSVIKLCASKASTYVGCQYAFWQTGAQNPKWSSSNTSVATIDSNGVLTAKAAGTTAITATEGSNSATCSFTVRNGTSTGISSSSVNLTVGKTVKLTAKTSVNWFSSNTNVATVSGGTVTAKGVGYATISAYTSSGASTCLVKVTEQAQPSVIKLCAAKASTYVGCQYAFWQTGAKAPKWSSSNTSVATIDSNGVLTAKAAGTTTIKAAEGSDSATCAFTVRNGTSTGISKSSLTLMKGTTANLTAKTSVNWFSSNTNVATVSGGTVTAKGVGCATISAYTSSGASTCLVKVTEQAQSSVIKLCAVKASSYVGCKYAFWQTGANSPKWSSSDTSIATIDSNGVLTAKAAGTAVIYAKENSETAYCIFTVKNGTSTGISKSSLTLEKGKTANLTAKSNVNWFSSNNNVATVSGGTVTAKGVGYATISAYNSSGASTCLVHVTESTPDIPTVEYKGYINEEYVNLRSGPGTGYSVVTSMSENTSITFISLTLYNSDWYHIKLADGTEGYVYKTYATKIEPPKITLSATTVTTYAGCKYAMSQSGAEYPTWSSSNTSVAAVDQNGIITAKAAGTAVITASENGGAGTCKLTVKNGTSTGISKTDLTLAAGKTAKLTAKTTVSWFSSNTKVATVSGGTVTAKSTGYATISAYNSNGASTCLVKVTEGDGTIKLNVTSAATYVGCRYAINMTGSTTASWTSSNTSVATVNSSGVVTAKAAGTATIKASNAVSTASCKITVYSGSGPGISSSEMTIPSGKSVLLRSDNSYASWSSSNTSIATVSNGIVDTKGTGYVTISAYTSYGASTCLLHVTSPAAIRFVYASPNSAPKNSSVTFKAITDKSRTAVKFVVSNGSTSYTVNAAGKVSDGSTYIWSGSHTLGISGTWKIKAYSKTASTDFATTATDGEGEVFVTNSTDTTTTVLGERRASDSIIDLIANFEGFLTSVTADYITGDPTLGYGKVVLRNEQFYNNLTKNEAYGYLCQTVNSGPYTTVTNNFLTSNNVKFNQRQFDALVCFAYNVGAYAITNDSDLKNTLLGTASGGKITAGGSGYVNESGVNLRSGAGTGNSVVTTMSYNTKFTFVDAKLYNSSWYKIKLTNGTTGYIYKDYASASGGTRDLANINKSAFTTRLLQYHHASGSCYIGLLWRRVDEVEIFFYGDYARDGDANKYNMYFRCANNSSFGIG